MPRLEGVYKTPSNEVSLTPRIRQTNYLKSNKDLNDDDWYVDFLATHDGMLGQRRPERQLPGDGRPHQRIRKRHAGQSGRSAASQRRIRPVQRRHPADLERPAVAQLPAFAPQPGWRIRPSSQRPPTTSSGKPCSPRGATWTTATPPWTLSLRHVLNAKNFFELALNGGNFLAERDGPPVPRTPRIPSASRRPTIVRSPTRSRATLTVGVTRSSRRRLGDHRRLRPADRRAVPACRPLLDQQRGTKLRRQPGAAQALRTHHPELLPGQPDCARARTARKWSRSRRASSWTGCSPSRLSGTLGVLYSMESAVGQIFQPETATIGLARQDRNYLTVEPRLSWRLTETTVGLWQLHLRLE